MSSDSGRPTLDRRDLRSHPTTDVGMTYVSCPTRTMNEEEIRWTRSAAPDGGCMSGPFGEGACGDALRVVALRRLPVE